MSSIRSLFAGTVARAFFITAAVGFVTGLSGLASAQSKSGSDDNAKYEEKTVYDFEDDIVEGDLQRPDGELINALTEVQHDSLIEIRRNFIPEMLKSLEDI